MQDLTIGLVQMTAGFGQIEENLRKITNFSLQAAEHKVDILCFPEMCIHGYRRGVPPQCPLEIPGVWMSNLRQIAESHQMIIAVGLAENNPAGNPYITQLLFFPDGSWDVYRKTHLGQSEESYYTAGESLPVYKSAKGKFAVQICWDTHFPEISIIQSLKGAEIIFAPHASPSIVGDRKEIWTKYLTARAYDNSVFLAACNLVGEDNGHSYSGGALVFDPKGNIIAEDFSQREGLLCVTLESSLINTIRQKERRSMRHSFYLAGRRPELYRDLLTRPTSDI